jgi:S-DNA-T family DNA segregation ATPase FtsK/SpoIIIE
MVHEVCAACGFDGAQFTDDELLHSLRSLGPQWQQSLRDAGDELRVRPAPATWSAIEYAAHSRDVTALHVFGVEQALTFDEPSFPPIQGDELIEAAATSYVDLDPQQVALELATQATLLADTATGGSAGSWQRGLTIGDSRQDIRFLLEHALHDSRHHLLDVQRGLNLLRDTASS